jgi:hypothetical protein
MKRALFFLFLLSLSALLKQGHGQISIKDSSIVIPSFQINYSYQFPFADMAERYGGNSYIGPGFAVKLASNWIVGAEAGFLFGNNVKNGFDRMNEIMTDDGNVISGDGVPAIVSLFERGYAITGRFGKLFPVLSPNPNSGIEVHFSAGYISHKIRIEVQGDNAPQLKGDYKRGYDRLTSGFTLSQAIGYKYMGNSRLVNFFIGMEIFEAFTRERREYHFDLMGQEAEPNRIDILAGPKISWIIPLYKRLPRDFYFY